MRRKVTSPDAVVVTHDEDWQLQAHCRSHSLDWFFPPDGESGAERAVREELARSVCRSCPVHMPCLGMALELEAQHGIWGGTNERERRRMRRRGALRAL